MVIDAVNDDSIKKPIYLLGNLVHNSHIDELLKSLNVIVVDGEIRYTMLDNIPDGSTIVFSAHGVSQIVKDKAKEKNMFIIDTTCPHVEKTFKLIEQEALTSDIYFIVTYKIDALLCSGSFFYIQFSSVQLLSCV